MLRIQAVPFVQFFTEKTGIRHCTSESLRQKRLYPAVVFRDYIPFSALVLRKNSVRMQNQFCSFPLCRFDLAAELFLFFFHGL